MTHSLRNRAEGQEHGVHVRADYSKLPNQYVIPDHRAHKSLNEKIDLYPAAGCKGATKKHAEQYLGADKRPTYQPSQTTKVTRYKKSHTKALKNRCSIRKDEA